MELRTRRLRIRPVTAGDAAAVLAYRGDPAVAAYLPHEPLDQQQTRELLDRAEALWASADQERFNLLFAVELDGSVIGDLHAWNTAEPLQPASADPADVWIGYASLPAVQGQGYATEAVASLLDWLLARGARRVFANCYLENTASIRLVQRLGFVEHGRYTAEQDECGKRLASCRMRLDAPAVRIRPARPADGRALQEIELQAGERFRTVGMDNVADDEPASLESLAAYSAAGRAWAATDDADVPVGYVLVDVVDGNAHIEQVSVLPERQGQGVGRALIEQVRRWAVASGRPSVTLTTFADVSWNAPLYRHLGFRVLKENELGPELLAVRDSETAHGLDPRTRVCMQLPLSQPDERA